MEVPMPTPMPHPSRWPTGGLGVAEGGIMPTLPTTPIDPRVIAWTLACVEHALKMGQTDLDLARLVKIGEGGLRMAEEARGPQQQWHPAFDSVMAERG
jgi:hypothetical protein